ncbi:hypothetical protein Tco_1555595 [Tanacetum coccineum]
MEDVFCYHLPSGIPASVGFQRISLTGFRSCASRSQTRASQSRQSTDDGVEFTGDTVGEGGAWEVEEERDVMWALDEREFEVGDQVVPDERCVVLGDEGPVWQELF